MIDFSKTAFVPVSNLERFKLRRFNFLMGCLHLFQAGLLFLLSNNFTLPITTSFLNFDVKARTIATNNQNIFNLRIGPLIALFLLISAIAHFIIVTPKIFNWYIENLKMKINYVRWYEYALSSSVMIVVIAMLCGMYDLPSLILIFTLNAMMNLFGLMMELHNQHTRTTNWTAYIFGCVAGIVPWIVIGMYFYGATASIGTPIPAFVYWVLISLFVFFNIFALNMFLQYKKIGKWKDYLFGEKIYIVLSLVAKTALAWQVFSGTLRPV